MAIIAYTDGSCLGNPGSGGFASILLDTERKIKKEISGGFRLTTNNRMELLAVIVALENLKQIPTEITIYSDSKYVCDAVEKKWVFNWEKKGFKGKKNEDLWRKFLIQYRKHKVSFQWVKGHAGNKLNERADELAVAAANSPNLKIDVEFETNDENSDLFSDI
ncbi:MAG: ribonuclease HI [Weeksellaceae bacterium]|nr:ribonuclease HI [Weeksellaceae bacterium]MDX9705145.1 ribonuclease HI [Weeksellaceae bacterium]